MRGLRFVDWLDVEFSFAAEMQDGFRVERFRRETMRDFRIVEGA